VREKRPKMKGTERGKNKDYESTRNRKIQNRGLRIRKTAKSVSFSYSKTMEKQKTPAKN
jgi:hypothetical protein